MNHITYIMPVMILCSLSALLHNYNHFLMCLLSLEALTISMIIMTFMFLLIHSQMNLLIILIILSLGACEASMGLACLVKMMRLQGSDSLKMLNTKYL